jgi:hypothetical protein
MITDEAAKFAIHLGSVGLVLVIGYAAVSAVQLARRGHPMLWLSVLGAMLLVAAVVLIPGFGSGATVTGLAGIALLIFGVSLDLLAPQGAPPASGPESERVDHRFE